MYDPDASSATQTDRTSGEAEGFFEEQDKAEIVELVNGEEEEAEDEMEEGIYTNEESNNSDEKLNYA